MRDSALGWVGCREVRWGLITQRAVRSLRIVMPTPFFNGDLGFRQRLKPFAVQAFIAKFVVKRFDKTVVPGLAGRDNRRPRLMVFQPDLYLLGGKFAAVIRAQKMRRSVLTEDPLQQVDNIDGSDGGGHPDRHSFPREFVQDAQSCERSTVGEAIMQDIVRPAVFRIFRLARPIRPSRCWPFGPPALRRQLEIMLFPQAPGLPKSQLAFDGRPAVAIARILACDLPQLP